MNLIFLIVTISLPPLCAYSTCYVVYDVNVRYFLSVSLKCTITSTLASQGVIGQAEQENMFYFYAMNYSSDKSKSVT